MKIIFTELAWNELQDAELYYELEIPGLGRKFREEVIKAVKRIRQYPKAWAIEKSSIRKSLLHKFPYKILYSIESDHITIIAIAHQHRRPSYWVERITSWKKQVD